MMSQRGSLIPGLPNEIALICLAEVPLVYRHCISSVCRGWRNLFREEHYWAVRRERFAGETLLLKYSTYLYNDGVWRGYFPATEQWVTLPLMPFMPMDTTEKGSFERSLTFSVVDEKLVVTISLHEIPSEDHCPPARSSKVFYFDLKRWDWIESTPPDLSQCELTAGAGNGLHYRASLYWPCRLDSGDSAVGKDYCGKARSNSHDLDVHALLTLADSTLQHESSHKPSEQHCS